MTLSENGLKEKSVHVYMSMHGGGGEEQVESPELISQFVSVIVPDTISEHVQCYTETSCNMD